MYPLSHYRRLDIVGPYSKTTLSVDSRQCNELFRAVRHLIPRNPGRPSARRLCAALALQKASEQKTFKNFNTLSNALFVPILLKDLLQQKIF